MEWNTIEMHEHMLSFLWLCLCLFKMFLIYVINFLYWTYTVAPVIKNLPAWQCRRHKRSLGRENPLEKGIKTHSSIPAWRIPWTEAPASLQSMDHRVRHDWRDLACVHALSLLNSLLDCASDFIFNHKISIKEAKTTALSLLAWRIPWTE